MAVSILPIAQRILGRPHDRVRCIGHFIALAATFAAAKVFLATVGFALFITHLGAERLPGFYIALAGLALVFSWALARAIDRARKLRLMTLVLAGILLAAAGGRLVAGFDPGAAAFIVLACAYIYEIAFDILFWVAFAAYVDTMELRRATPPVYMALAVGGALGGLLARVAAGVLGPLDLLLLLLPLTALGVLQLSVAARRLRELKDPRAPDDPAEGPAAGWLGLFALALRYPLLLVVALNAALLTILYGLSEYLIFSVYGAHYPDERELTRFLALVFASMQTIEFVLLSTLSWFLLERTSALARNLVFPLTSLVSLCWLAFSHRLSAAVLTHINVEAVSNAVFQPVNNANYIPLPLHLQGRARTLCDGIFYPSGLAVAGLLLWATASPGLTVAAEFIALLFAVLFVMLNVGVGWLFLPTLLQQLAGGAGTSLALRPFWSPPRLRIGRLAAAPDPGPPALDLLRLDDPWLLLGPHDRTTRSLVTRLLAGRPANEVQPLLDAALESTDESARLIALQVLMAHRQAVPQPASRQALQSSDPLVGAIARLLGPEQGRDRELVAPASDLAQAIVAASRSDLAVPLIGLLDSAAPAEQRQGLELIRRSPAATLVSARELALRLLASPEPGVRAEALTLLGRAGGPETQDLLAAHLGDPSGAVRRQAALALAERGDAVLPLLAAHLGPAGPGSAGAAVALERIATPQAQRILHAYLRRLRAEGRTHLPLLGQVKGRGDALEVALQDALGRLFDLAMVVLEVAVDPVLVRHLRTELRAPDQRVRANAFQVLTSIRYDGTVPVLAGLVGLLLFEQDNARLAGADPVAAAAASADPWVRRAAGLVRGAGGGETVSPGERDLQRVLLLKRLAVFRDLPLDTLEALVRDLRPQAYHAGEVVLREGALLDHLGVLEAGSLTLTSRTGRQEVVTVPGCYGEAALSGEPVTGLRIEARERSRVLRLSPLAFEALSQDRPELALALARFLARRLQLRST